jgi:AraC-like DNA-binding protein
MPHLPSRLGQNSPPTVKSSTTRATDLLHSDGTLAVDARLLEQLFDQTPDIAFFIKDISGRYTVVNHSLVTRNGLRDKSQVIGLRPRDLFPGDLGRIPSDQDAAVIRTGRPILDHLELHWRAPHRPVWCLTTKLPLRDAAGGITGLIGISRDVRVPVGLADIPAGVSRALEHLERNFADPVSPSSLAKRSGLSPSRFARLVKRIFGITPGQLITKTRLAAASVMLKETDRSIADIAIDCGFFDHSAFTRAFRSATGLTPTQFRAAR